MNDRERRNKRNKKNCLSLSLFHAISSFLFSSNFQPNQYYFNGFWQARFLLRMSKIPNYFDSFCGFFRSYMTHPTYNFNESKNVGVLFHCILQASQCSHFFKKNKILLETYVFCLPVCVSVYRLRKITAQGNSEEVDFLATLKYGVRIHWRQAKECRSP